MENANQGEADTQTEEVESQDGQGSEESVQTEQQEDKFGALQAQLSQLAGVVNGFSGQFGQLQEALKPKPRSLTAQEKAALMQADPAAAIESIVAEKVSTQTDVIKREMDKKYWDTKVENDFPIKDQAFLEELKRQWNGLVDSGIDANNPKAVYKAAEQAALIRGVKKPVLQQQQKQYLSAENGAEYRAPRPKSSVSDNDPRVKVYAMLADVTPKKIAEFKKGLEDQDAKRRR